MNVVDAHYWGSPSVFDFFPSICLSLVFFPLLVLSLPLSFSLLCFFPVQYFFLSLFFVNSLGLYRCPPCSLSSPDKDEISRACVLGELGHQQSCHSWLVGNSFLDVIRTSWQQKTRRWTDKLVMEVVGIAMCLVACIFSFFTGSFPLFFRGRRQWTRMTNDAGSRLGRPFFNLVIQALTLLNRTPSHNCI